MMSVAYGRNHFHSWSDSIQSHGPTIKDQEHMVQDLKKENFDLKLRLYMEQKQNETSTSKIEEYEQQITQLLDKLEESSRMSKLYEKELKDTRVREKTLITKQKRLEVKCAEQDEKIHNLSLDVSRLQSMSMQDLSSVKQSTPLRHAQSEYRLKPHSEDEFDVSEDEASEGYVNEDSKPFSSVRPIIRGQSMDSNGAYEEEADDDETKDPTTSGVDEGQSLSINQRHNSARSYTSQYTPVKNFYRYENTDGKPVATTLPRLATDIDNIGIVRPNNSRIGIEATIDTYIPDMAERKAKKKKKGLMKIFRLCGGGKSSSVQRNNSVYQKTNITARPLMEAKPFPEERLLEVNHRL